MTGEQVSFFNFPRDIVISDKSDTLYTDETLMKSGIYILNLN
jgi:hypothetical protein